MLLRAGLTGDASASGRAWQRVHALPNLLAVSTLLSPLYQRAGPGATRMPAHVFSCIGITTWLSSTNLVCVDMVLSAGCASLIRRISPIIASRSERLVCEILVLIVTIYLLGYLFFS